MIKHSKTSILRTLLPLILLASLATFTHAQTRVIANWDMVPYQVFKNRMKVGVVAFHETGAVVDFKVNGRPIPRVTKPTFNPDVFVWEYWIELQAADYADGEVTVSATASPGSTGHLPRTLSDLKLYANARGSLTNNRVLWADCRLGDDTAGTGSEGSPYKTLEKAYSEVGTGGTVYLKAGDCYQITNYYPSKNYGRWTTITAAPGLKPADVKIGGYREANSAGESGRFGENFVRWRNVSMYSDNPPGYGTVFYFESSHHIWFDGVEMFDAKGRWNGSQPFGGNSGYKLYITNSLLRDFMNAGGHFMRNVRIRTIGSDIYRPGNGTVGINVDIDGIDPGATGAHPDFVQFYNPGQVVENVIIYNNRVLNMGAQGLFGANCRDVAFVNLLMEKDPPESYATGQFSEVWDHILLWHATSVDSGMLIRGGTADKTNWNVQNNLLSNLHAGSETALPGATIAHNHYSSLVWNQTNGPMGSYATVGEPFFVDNAADDFRVQKKSPAYRRGVPLPGLPADLFGKPYHARTPSLGAIEYSNSAPPSFPPTDGTAKYRLTVSFLKGKQSIIECRLRANGLSASRTQVEVQRQGRGKKTFRTIKKGLTGGSGTLKARPAIRGLYRCAYTSTSDRRIYSKTVRY